MNINNFNWNVEIVPKITIFNEGIYLSVGSMALLGEPKRVELGLDTKNQLLAIKAATTGGFRVTKRYFSCKNAILNILNMFKVITTGNIKLQGAYDKELNILIFNLSRYMSYQDFKEIK